jgi:hypothetical protein
MLQFRHKTFTQKHNKNVNKGLCRAYHDMTAASQQGLPPAPILLQ